MRATAPASEAMVDSPCSDQLDAGWLHERLGQHLWREDEVPGELVHVQLVQKRASEKKGLRLLGRATLRRHDGTLVEQIYAGSSENKSWLSKPAIVPPMGRAVIRVPGSGDLAPSRQPQSPPPPAPPGWTSLVTEPRP